MSMNIRIFIKNFTVKVYLKIFSLLPVIINSKPALTPTPFPYNTKHWSLLQTFLVISEDEETSITLTGSVILEEVKELTKFVATAEAN